MTILEFPPVHSADEQGLLAVGGDLDIDSLLLAYRSGVFPWPLNQEILTWFAPPERAVLFLEEFHIPRSLRKEMRRANYSFGFDKNFETVINSCAELKNRGSQSGTWITDAIVEAYIRLNRAGYCHSIECYHDDQLVGGLYGVSIGGMFAGESMFYRRPNASKLALAFAVEKFRAQGAQWIDCQVMTPHMQALGAQNVPRSEYMKLLRAALKRPALRFENI